MKNLIKTLTAAMLFATIFMPLLAEDTELFVVDVADREGYRPKVLIIFDNSGSMGTHMTVHAADYDPSEVYPELEGENGKYNDTLFYTVSRKGDSKPPKPGSGDKRYFSTTVNACAESLKPLAQSGRFVGNIREFETEGWYKGRWRSIPNYDGRGIGIIDCQNDMVERNTLNPFGSVDYAGLDADGNPIINSTRSSQAASPFNDGPGYPYDSRNANGPLYTEDYSKRNTKFYRSSAVTLYTVNYLRWYYSVGLPKETTRLAVAKEAVTNLIQSVPGVDFGLMVFNHNGSDGKDGGRIIRGIEQSSADSHKEVIDIVNSLDANTWTPLCETLYEAKRYFSGDSVKYGKADPTRMPFMDERVADSGAYISPFDECSDVAYVILVTDGEPTYDTNADSEIQSLDGVTSSQKVGYGDGGQYSYLAALANYMHKNDLFNKEPNLEVHKAANDGREPKQTVTTYTIGFGEAAASDAAELLSETALRGGGQYFEATGSVGLESALFDAMIDILLTDSSMTSPAIAANNFDRTRSLDNIYYSMFMPAAGSRWGGNIKKLKLDASGILKDKNGMPAIDAAGNIKETAVTFWDFSNDAEYTEEIARDGVNASLTQYVKKRRVYTEMDGALVSLDSLPNSEATAVLFGVEIADLSDLKSWIYGVDVDDGDGDGDEEDARLDIFSDPFHSKPLVLNLSENLASADLRLVVGTNAGILHFFQDYGETVTESWAYIPKEFLKSQSVLRQNKETSGKLYGVDGSPVTYKHGDKTYLFFGLRRGGSAYYALDITYPDSPKFMWKIDANTPGFEELGQSWGRPVISKIPGFKDATGNAQPVMIISGGYDTNKDTLGVGSSDTRGRGLFFVDVTSGKLVWSLSPGADSSYNKSFIEFTDSMPAAPAVLDSDGDGLTDRVYLSDTGGHVWRVDLYSEDKSNWGVHLLAELGGADSSTDRRFFYTPSITRTLEKTTTQVSIDGSVSTQYGIKAYDAILIGSGDRTRLLSSKEVQDYFYMLKDENISVMNTANGLSLPEPILMTQLADISHDPLGTASSETELIVEQAALSGARGWQYKLEHNDEKAVGDAIVIEGTVYFTSFTPPGAPSDGVCAQMGAGRVYAVNLHTGMSVHNWRSMEIGERVPDTLVVHSGVDEEGESTLRILGAGQGDQVGFDLNKDGQIGETETVNSGNILSFATMVPKKEHTHEELNK